MIIGSVSVSFRGPGARAFRYVGTVGLVVASLVAFGFPRASRAEVKPGVLIFPIRAGDVGLTDPGREDLKKYLAVRLTSEGVYQVMPEVDIQKALGAAKIESYRDCYDDSCRIELGRAVTADKSLSLDITKAGRQCRIMATIYDIRTEMSEAAGDARVGCDMEALYGGIGAVAAQLSGKSAGGDLTGESAIGVTESGIVSSGLTVDLGEKIVNSVTDEMGFLTVRTHRKGEEAEAHAMVLLNGAEFRPADFTVEQMVGEYVIAARLDEYHHLATKRIRLDREGATVDLELLPAFGGLSVMVDPPGAEVLINDRVVGTTSASGTWADSRIKSGRYTIELRKNLYRSEKRLVTISDGNVTTEEFSLDPDFGHLELTSEPAGARVYLDGRDSGVTGAKALVFKNLSEGPHVVRLVKDFYLAEERRVDVADGAMVRINVALKSDFGGLKVVSDPPGATVIFDDRNTGRVTPIMFSPVKPGIHVVALELNGYGRAVGKASVEAGKTAEVSMPLQPKLGLLSVLSEKEDGSPCDGEVTVDGAVVGRTPWKGDVLALGHKVGVRCAEGAGSAVATVPHNGRESVTIRVGNRGHIAVESFYEDGSECRGAVSLNGQERGQTPWKEWMDSGQYEIRVDCADGVGQADVEIARGQMKTVRVEVSGRPVYSPWPWVTAGIGAGVIVGGGLLNLFADLERDKISDAETGSDGVVTGISRAEALDIQNRANKEDNAATAMYAVGGAAVLTGLIWGIVDVVSVGATREKTKSRARISGILMPGGGGIGFAGGF